MVGVGGRSKACATCKSRHVRCDERRPSCRRCERIGFTCPGYERPIIFINAMPSVAHKRLVMPSSPESNDPPRPIIARHEASRDQSHPSSSGLTSAFPTSPSGRPAPPGCSASSPGTAGLATGASQMLISEQARRFIEQLLTAQGVGKRLNQICHHKSDKRLPVLEISIEAAALILHGRLTQNALSVYQATKLCGMALQQLRTQLAHGYGIGEWTAKTDASLLVAIMNMTLFEWVAGSTKDAWKGHVRGLAAVIESCGPGAFRNETMRQAFEQARGHIMVLHMDESRRTFLEEPSWQEIPWSHDAGHKSFRGLFIDIICCIPGLLEDDRRLRELERVSANTTATNTCAQNTRQQDIKKTELELQSSMRERVIYLYTKLLNMRWRWELEYPNCCYEIPVLPPTRSPQKQQSDPVLSVDETTRRPIFNTVLFFKSLTQAIEMNFYHSCLLLLHSFAKDLGIMDELILLRARGIISDLYRDAESAYSNVQGGDAGDHGPSSRLPPPFSFKNNKALVFPYEAHTDHYATRDILRTVDFLLQPKHGPAGAYYLIFPLRIAQIYHELLLSLPDDDPRFNNPIPFLLEDAEKDGRWQEPRESHTAGVPLHICSDTSASNDDLNSHIGHINIQVATQSRRPQAVQATSETDKGSLTESKYNDTVSAWIQRIMRYIGDVQGFGITNEYN
ncbi:hypothetical protein V8C35DRAFT_323319 [Trichoderma chlorosporum]